MEPEVQVLFTVFLLALFFSFMAVRYFLRRARLEGGDRLLALRNGLLLAFALFAISILIYDAIKPAREIEDRDTAWCQTNPERCRSPVPLFSVH